MRSGEADAMKQAEEALAVLTQEREALQAELGQTEAEQQVVVAMRAEFERLQSVHMAESRREAADTREASLPRGCLVAPDRDRGIMYVTDVDTSAWWTLPSRVEDEALSAVNVDKQALQEQIDDQQDDVSIKPSTVDAKQQRSTTLQEECEHLKAEHAAAEVTAARINH